ncbi:MAG: flagellum-specific ATP synthase [Polyangiales bacterium]
MNLASLAAAAAGPIIEGRLVEALGLVLEAEGCDAAVGDRFEVVQGDERVLAEVVGMRGTRTLLMPLGSTTGLRIGSALRRRSEGSSIGVGNALLGRVLDGLGRPLDGKPAPATDARWPLQCAPSHPLLRRPVDQPLGTGIPAMDALLTLGVGQRIGIFAGGGVGKSTLLASMVERAACDVCVVALIGERGREVEEWVHRTLGEEGLARSVVVAATSADPPLVRARGALHATAIAESFRAQGKKVLLVMDSVTRFAMALREVGLARGEAPATKGYPPSVFAALPALMERAGTCDGPGSITGVYTVLVEGDDLGDPIADAARAILDGHIVLDRDLAERGWYPAINVGQSISRVMTSVVSPEHAQLARDARGVLAAAAEAEDLRSLGAYTEGSNPRFDRAVARMPALSTLLRANPGSVPNVLTSLKKALS